MKLDKALGIDGWMSEPELRWLATQAKTHHCIVELGCYKGRSTRVLADNTPGFVIAIDDWKGCRDGVPSSLSTEEQDELFDAFKMNVFDLIASGKVLPMRMEHSKVSEFIDFNIDMVFIDGDHSYSAVKQDIMIWKRKLSPGGLLCGHDIQSTPVNTAVKDVLPSYSVVEGTTIWQRVA